MHKNSRPRLRAVAPTPSKNVASCANPAAAGGAIVDAATAPIVDLTNLHASDMRHPEYGEPIPLKTKEGKG